MQTFKSYRIESSPMPPEGVGVCNAYSPWRYRSPTFGLCQGCQHFHAGPIKWEFQKERSKDSNKEAYHLNKPCSESAGTRAVEGSLRTCTILHCRRWSWLSAGARPLGGLVRLPRLGGRRWVNWERVRIRSSHNWWRFVIKAISE